MVGQRMGDDGQIRPAFGLIEIPACRTGASSLRRHGSVHRPKPLLLIAVEVVGTWISRLDACFYHRMEQWVVIVLWRGDAYRAVAAVVVVGADITGFRLAVIGQAVEVTPVFEAWLLRPVVEIHRVAANVAHAVNQR